MVEKPQCSSVGTVLDRGGGTFPPCEGTPGPEQLWGPNEKR